MAFSFLGSVQPIPLPGLLRLKLQIKLLSLQILILLRPLPVESPEVRSDPGTSCGLHFILSQSLGLGIILGKTLLQVFPGLFVTSQLNTIFFLN